jgi:hypothetical protein
VEPTDGAAGCADRIYLTRMREFPLRLHVTFPWPTASIARSAGPLG